MSENLLQGVIFWAFALLSVGGALGAVFHKSIIYAALFMLLVFLSMSGFFILNNADFLAIAQLILYAVGLTIIMLFAIMFTGDKPLVDNGPKKSSMVAYGIISAFVLALLLKATTFPFRAQAMGGASGYMVNVLPTEGSIQQLGLTLFKTYSLPFELASILLLIAMVGAIVLAKKTFDDYDHATAKYVLDERSQPTDEARKALARHDELVAGKIGAGK